MYFPTLSLLDGISIVAVESTDRSRSPSWTGPRRRLWMIAVDSCAGRSLACRSRALPGSDTVPVIVPVIALATSRVAVERAPAVIRPTSLSILPELPREDPARFLRSGVGIALSLFAGFVAAGVA